MALITDIIDGVKRHETNSVLSRSARKYYWIKALSDWIEASPAFDPLALSPYLYYDARSGVLAPGGGAAGYLSPVATLANPGSASDAAQATAASQPHYLPLIGGAGYLHVPPVAGNHAAIADSAALRPTGDMELIVRHTARDWTPAATRTLVLNGDNNTAVGINWYLNLNTTGTLVFYRSAGATLRTYVSTVATGIADGTPKWLRVTWAQDNGAGSSEVKFFLSDDGVTWTQLGAAVTNASTGAGNNHTAGTRIGEPLSPWVGDGAFHRVIVKSGIGGTTALDVDFADAAHGAASFACTTGQTVTINKSGNNPAAIIGTPAIRFDGVDDFLSGTFAAAISGGRMFAVFRVLGDGGEPWGRVLSMAAAGAPDSGSTGFRWGYHVIPDLNTYYNGATRTSHASGFSGRFMSEVAVSPTGIISRRNNTDEKTATVDTTAIASTEFAMGGHSVNGGFNPSIDLEHLSVFPASMTDDEAVEMREKLNSELSIY